MKIELSIEQIQAIGQVLETGPYKIVAPLLSHLQREINRCQLEEQTAAAQPPPAEAKKGNGELHLDKA